MSKGLDKKTIKNINDLWHRLSCLFDDLENGDVEYKIAAELNNTAGKMINLAKTQLEYYALRKENPQINFLEEPKTTAPE